MESKTFDTLVREAFEGTSRRGVLRGAVGLLAVAAAPFALPDVVDAKKKGNKRKKKKKDRCPSNRPVTCGNGCCPSNFSQCCEGAESPTNSFTCNPADFTCCPLEQGGGSCSPSEPQCCPPTEFDPFGFCAAATDTCCTTEQGGGSCPEDFPTCCPFDCCDEGVECCGPEGSCPTGFVCDFDGEEGFCCVPEVAARAAGRSASSRKRHGERFRMKAK